MLPLNKNDMKKLLINYLPALVAGSLILSSCGKPKSNVTGWKYNDEKNGGFEVIPYDEQIKTERFKQGERVRAYLVDVDDSGRGVFLRLSRSHPKFLGKLFELEVPEIKAGTIEIKSIAREAGMRSKIAVWSKDSSVDPVGAMVGQRGSRVSVVMSELHGERIDIIEYVEDLAEYVERSLSPARVLGVDIDEVNKTAHAVVTEDQQSLAIGKGGQNVRLAAKLTGWRIDIKSVPADQVAEYTDESDETDGE